MSSSASSAAPLIAIVEDEEHLAQGLLFNLELEGYRTVHEMDGDAALRYLLSTPEPPSAVLLDVMLPGKDGFAITRALREAGRFTPILLLTARGRTEDVLEGFAAGADDYLPKPFDLGVLLARLRGLLRRTAWQRTGVALEAQPAAIVPAPAPTAVPELVPVGERVIDFALLEIRHRSPDGKAPIDLNTPAAPAGNKPAVTGAGTVHLTLMEADLLRYLLTHHDRVVSRKEILEEVWHVQADTDTRPIDNFVVRLRRYLEPDPTNPVYLLTARGVGYRFVTPEADRAT